MSNSNWYYRKLEKGDTVRDPIQGEFFATEAIENSADALVREGIQNSLDARIKNNGKFEQLRIRIYLSGPGKAVSADDLHWLLQSNWPHILADGNGLQDPRTRRSLVIFSCSRILAQPGSKAIHPSGRRLLASETISSISSEPKALRQKRNRPRALGRWQNRLPRSSRISTFWAVTRRDSDGSVLLFGRTILKSHDLANGETYVPDGYFGTRVPGTHIVMPIVDSEVIERFCRTFLLERYGYSGLSIVVPYFDQTEICVESVKHAITVATFYLS